MVNNASRGEKFRGEVSSRRWGELSVVRRPCGADHFGPSYFLPNKGARGGPSLSGIFPRFCFEHKARSGRSPFRSERISPTFLVYTFLLFLWKKKPMSRNAESLRKSTEAYLITIAW